MGPGERNRPPRPMGPAHVHAFPGNEVLAAYTATSLGARWTSVIVDRFPDGEARVRIDPTAASPVPAIVICSLHRPDETFLPLIFAAGALRDAGVSQVGLVAPYLPYMRQDTTFAEGEAVSAIHFARVLSDAIDWLVTVEPHLHRIASLDAIYSIPACAIRVRDAVAAWVVAHVADPVIIGPDAESRQWARSVAEHAGIPFEILQKRRVSSTQVEVSVPSSRAWQRRTPVIVDDVIATGHTVREAARQLRTAGARDPVCVAVHAHFAGDAYATLLRDGVRVVTTNTIPHPSNAIDVSGKVTEAVTRFIGPGTR